jgi:hypothetical protein
MKKYYLLLASALLSLTAAEAQITNVLWDFNAPSSHVTGDTNALTGTYSPYIGAGTISAINVGSNSFGNPPSGGATATSDSWTNDNSAFRMGIFPAQGLSNKTAGMQFFTSTEGLENIKVRFDQENSATASRYWRAQYSTNGGATWIDNVTLLSADGTAWLKGREVDLSTAAGAKNNPNFGFRYVSEFSNSSSVYVANSTGSSYGTGGTLWLDMVHVVGTPLNTNNTDPTISSISDLTNRVNQTIGPLAFTVTDVETAASNLVVTVQSSNTGLINNNYSLGGGGSNRTITLTPEPDQIGTTTITLLVTDEGNKAISTSFMVTVLPANTPPVLSAGVTRIILVNTTTNIPFTVSDLETNGDAFTYTVESWNPAVLSSNSMQFGGTGNNRILQITTAETNIGATKLRIIVTDGTLVVSNLFTVKVVRPSQVVLWNFNSSSVDNNPGTGTFNPAIGSGTFTLLNVTTNSFAALGTGNVDQQASDGVPVADNSSLRLAQFPLQGTSNQMAGVQLQFSTAGYQNIAVTWDQQNSSSASRFYRIQYTLDGVNYTNYLGYSNVLDGLTFPTGVNFTGVAGVDNNPNFGMRIVTEWESSAIPGGSDNYWGVQINGNYGTNGTFWSDMYSVTADLAPASPALQVSYSGGSVQLAWPTNVTGYVLESTPTLTSPNWQNPPEPVGQTNGQNVVSVPASETSRFFRLKK